ncbi:hypothetical protein Taro_048038 [Colocasia esculenta]|uniref:Uncharacterized protein n=1 Tax=Colocasia esculenta TaxID=4460 RepID=A0A843X7M1_COLES|nr:hypothetical protein [Colocasia esculenta]
MNLASMPLTPRSLVCVQRSGRPLLERPETAVKFSRIEQCTMRRTHARDNPYTHYLLRRTSVVGDTSLEETVESDSERGE